MSLSSLLLSGGFALLATTGALSAGLGGPAGGAAVGAVTFAGVVTGLVPLAAAGALGILGIYHYKFYCEEPFRYQESPQCCVLARPTAPQHRVSVVRCSLMLIAELSSVLSPARLYNLFVIIQVSR